jgi:hypothetical protein
MLNRPSTRIELKLEEDIIELDETKELRQNNFFKNDDFENSEYKQFTPEPNKPENYNNYQTNNFEITQTNPIAFTPKADSSPFSEDISMR